MSNQIVIAILAFLILTFQNCSQVEFEALGEGTARSNAFEIADECIFTAGDCSEKEQNQGGEPTDEGDGSIGSDEVVDNPLNDTDGNSNESSNDSDGSGDEVVENPQDSGDGDSVVSNPSESTEKEEPETSIGSDINCNGKCKKQASEADGNRSGKKESAVVSACGANNIADVILNVKYVEMGQQVLGSLVGSLSLKEISNGFDITSDSDVEGNQIRLVLEDEGNYIKDVGGALLPLKTPSQQNSGLKVLVAETQMAANGVYTLTFNLNLDKQIIINPVKCLLKPIIKKGILD